MKKIILIIFAMAFAIPTLAAKIYGVQPDGSYLPAPKTSQRPAPAAPTYTGPQAKEATWFRSLFKTLPECGGYRREDVEREMQTLKMGTSENEDEKDLKNVYGRKRLIIEKTDKYDPKNQYFDAVYVKKMCELTQGKLTALKVVLNQYYDFFCDFGGGLVEGSALRKQCIPTLPQEHITGSNKVVTEFDGTGGWWYLPDVGVVTLNVAGKDWQGDKYIYYFDPGLNLDEPIGLKSEFQDAAKKGILKNNTRPSQTVMKTLRDGSRTDMSLPDLGEAFAGINKSVKENLINVTLFEDLSGKKERKLGGPKQIGAANLCKILEYTSKHWSNLRILIEKDGAITEMHPLMGATWIFTSYPGGQKDAPGYWVSWQEAQDIVTQIGTGAKKIKWPALEAGAE